MCFLFFIITEVGVETEIETGIEEKEEIEGKEIVEGVMTDVDHEREGLIETGEIYIQLCLVILIWYPFYLKASRLN